MDESKFSEIVDQVIQRLTVAGKMAGEVGAARLPSVALGDETGHGVFAGVDAAISAACEAQQRLAKGGFAMRTRAVEAIRCCTLKTAEVFARMAVEESKMGRVEDKIKKNILAGQNTPGIENLHPYVFTGDKGMTLQELAPWGVIGAIIPCTNSTETICCNGIGMIAAGNTVVFNPHPLTTRTSIHCVQSLNQAIVAAGLPENLITTVAEPTISTAQELMRHSRINLLVVTGGPAVVSAAMKSGKKVIAAGPGNPPILVDETANLRNAARDLVAGHSFDNNIICICEKVLVVVESVANKLKEEILKLPVTAINKHQTERLAKKVLEVAGSATEEGRPSRDFVGRNARVLLESIGLKGDDALRTVLAEVDRDHTLAWTEQLMPVLPMVRAKDFEEALDLCLKYERGYRHTATMFSMNIDHLSRAALAFNCSVFIKNGPSYAGLGFGGEGFASFTIASPTGEGLTSARNFTRERRCVLANYFRIV